MTTNPYTLEEPFSNFYILDLEQAADVTRLKDLVLAANHHTASPAGYALLDMLLKDSHCRSVVVEKIYFDRDHLRSYQRFYARGFSDFARFTTRLHFFTIEITIDALSNLEDGPYQNSYLGFCVLRPLRVRKVGRSVLNPFSADPKADYALSLSNYEVNLAGSSLTVFGAPFLEQDVNVGACATAAVWMCTMVAGRLLDIRPWTTAEITEAAFDYPLGEQVLAARGLAAGEMESALRKMGYKPLIWAIRDEISAMEVIHPYLEGGIPPILLLELEDGGHAIVAVGHGYDPNMTPLIQAEVEWEGTKINYWRSSQWINYLLVHDDQRGPYRRMQLRSEADLLAWEAANPNDKPSCLAEIDMAFPHDQAWPASEKARIFGAVIPVPVGVTLTGLEAEEKSARLIHMYFDGTGEQMPSDFVLRTYLVRSNEFKKTTIKRGIAKRVSDLWRSKSLPRWLWVTEICQQANVPADRGRRRIIGEVILDGNGSPFSPDFISVHIVATDNHGYVALMRSSDDDALEALLHGLLYEDAVPYLAFTGPGIAPLEVDPSN